MIAHPMMNYFRIRCLWLHISHFIENVVRPHVVGTELDAGYRAMAANEEREAEALQWSEATIGDASVGGEIQP
jgi:hypothetical protein